MNPKGFYEDRNIVTKLADGVYEGKAAKIFLKQFHMIEYFLGKKWKEILDQSKIILCVRDLYVSEISMVLSSTLPFNEGRMPDLLEDKKRLVQIVMDFLDKNRSIFDRMHRIKYENFVNSPGETIQELVRFLEIDPSTDQIKAAVDNVEPRLMRTSTYDLRRDMSEQSLIVFEAVENLGNGILDFSRIGRP
jgi:hypothetical protein